MKQWQFETLYQGQWQDFAEQLSALEQGKAQGNISPEFPAQYRQLCQHLAIAQARHYSAVLIDQLQHLALRGHQQLYRHRSHLGGMILGFILQGFPRLVRAQWRAVSLACLVFFGSLLGMGVLTYLFPELIYSLLSTERVLEMDQMYDSSRRKARNADDDWLMFGYYIFNNVSIAFQTFASGLLAGVGSLFYLFFNGLVIGAIAGHLTEAGFGDAFWSFVIGHGAFELTAIALAGAAGLKLGWSLLAPGQLRRSHALKMASKTAIALVSGAFFFLLIAAFIEAFWSSSQLPAAIKYGVGAALWILVLSYFVLAGRGEHAPE